ncbi:MAG: universal stress protein [Bacillota bacterium]
MPWQNGGRLKLLVGIISWPGNTEALLREGQELAGRGREVVVGILQHESPEITALKETFFHAPPLFPAGDGQKPVLNLPFLLGRKPDVVLVDDAGEKNPPGSEYGVRWQEIEALLDAGIDVVATVDALHLEGFRSLLPLSMSANGKVTVPLSFLRHAAEVELVDVTPEELSRHGLELPPGFEPSLSLGRYLASANFVAFRRTVLQRIADEVDERLLRPGFETRAAAARERILLAVSGPVNLERLLGKSMALATHLQASLLVVHLRVPQRRGRKELPREYIAEAIAPVAGTFLEEEIADEAEVPDRLSQLVAEKHITRMVVGHSARTRLVELLHGSVLTELLHRNRHIDVLVVANLPPGVQEEATSQDEAPVSQEHLAATPLPGKLKIYLGPAAGVGKTYKMLRDANDLKAKGADVVIGYVETYGRAETAAQIGALEVLPRKDVLYRGRVFTELDLEAVLRQRPQVALIDELAHTNVPGVKNSKRYQDVIELLSAGIDVWTTLNVQHVESLNDLVEDITGVKVRETVPDWVLGLATEIILIDLSSELLLQRMEEGKIYPPEKAAHALKHFFRPENITALRELALRQLARHLAETKSFLPAPDRPGSGPEKVLVAVNLRPYAERLIRRGLRLSVAQKAELLVVHCNATGEKFDPVAANTRHYLQHLCSSLGIPYVEQPVFGVRDVAPALIDLCRTKKISQLVLGHTRRTRWQELLKGTIIDRLLQELRTVDLHLVPVNGALLRAKSGVERKV